MFYRKWQKTYINRILLMALVLALILPGSPAGAEEANGLNIKQAIDFSYASDPNVKNADITVRLAQLQRDKLALQYQYFVPNGTVLPADQAIVSSFQQADISLGVAKKAQKIQQDVVSDTIIGRYTAVVKAQTTLETKKMELYMLQRQESIGQVSKEVGMMSQFDWDTLERGIAQKQEDIKSSEIAVDSARISLNEAMGMNRADIFTYLSLPTLDTVKRSSLEAEISMGIDNSSAVWQTQQALANEKIKNTWVRTDVPSDIADVQLSQAQQNDAKAKKDARASIESLFYGIDQLEKGLQANKLALASAQNSLNIAEVKYRVGTLPMVTLTGSDLLTARVNAEKARITLLQSRLDLIKYKADLYVLTGRTVYDANDWQNTGWTPVNLSSLGEKSSSAFRVVFSVGSKSYTVDGNNRTMNAAPYIKSGRTYVPVGYLAEALEASSSWDPNTRKATLIKGAKTVTLKMGDSTIGVNGRYTNMDVSPELIKGRLMLPARYVVDAFGGRTTWDDKTHQIVIYK